MALPVGVIVAARSTVRSYLDMLQTVGIEAAKESPPPTDLERLRARGTPTVSDEAFAARLETLAERRRLLGWISTTAMSGRSRDRFSAGGSGPPRLWAGYWRSQT